MDSHPSTLLLSGLGVAGTVVVYLFCVLGHEAILRSRSGPLRERAKQGSHSAKLARVILTSPERYIIASQVWMVLSCLFAGLLLVRLSLADLGAAWLSGQLGLEHYGALIELAIVLMGALLVAAVTVFLAQFARALARGCPEDVLCRGSRLLIAMGKLLSPVIRAVELLAGSFLRSLGSQLPAARQRAMSVNEITELVQSGAISGGIEDDDRELLEGVFSFSQTVVREVMTPRNDIVYIEDTAALESIVDLFVTEGFSRVLVVGSGGLDDIKGILIAKDFLPFIGRSDPDFSLAAYIRKPYIVPVSKAVDDLLREMRRDSVHIAIVVDEHGGTDGIVTIEDLLEEIVGEIFDEFDAPEEEVDVIKTKSGDLLAEGSVTIDDLNDIYHFDFPDGDYDTLAGFVLQQLGHIPKLGETLEYRSTVLRIEQVSRNRIKLVRIMGRKNGSKSNDLSLAREARAERSRDTGPARVLKTGT